MKRPRTQNQPFLVPLAPVDEEILSFLVFWTCCEEAHLCDFLQISKRALRGRLKRLEKVGVIVFDGLFVGRSSMVRLSSYGAKQLGRKPVKPLTLSHYFHEMCVIDVALGLKKKYPHATWISSQKESSVLYGRDACGWDQEQRPWGKEFTKGLQIPDGYLVVKNRLIAIEVELTLKNKRRREEIYKNYAIALDVDEVWYICPLEVACVLKRDTDVYPFIKVILLSDLIGKGQAVSSKTQRVYHA